MIRSWTDAEDAVVDQSFVDGLSDAEIAAKLPGRSPAAVQTRRQKMGLLRTNVPPPGRPKGERPVKLTPWPADMPRFEDHPKPVLPGERKVSIRA